VDGGIVAKPQQLRKPPAVAERRAANRAPAAGKAATARRPRLPNVLPTAAAGRLENRTEGMFNWVRDVRSELRKCAWPTREEATKLTSVVIAISILVGCVLGLADAVFAFIIRLFLGTGG
jgi:preprotein translocase SecE subunit